MKRLLLRIPLSVVTIVGPIIIWRWGDQRWILTCLWVAAGVVGMMAAARAEAMNEAAARLLEAERGFAQPVPQPGPEGLELPLGWQASLLDTRGSQRPALSDYSQPQAARSQPPSSEP